MGEVARPTSANSAPSAVNPFFFNRGERRERGGIRRKNASNDERLIFNSIFLCELRALCGEPLFL